MAFRLPEYDRVLAGYRLTEVPDRPPYFQMRATGRIHHVRQVQRVERDGEVWFSIRFWCHNIALPSAGWFLRRVGKQDLVCARCIASHRQSGRGRAST
jgi:hypothetical protein